MNENGMSAADRRRMKKILDGYLNGDMLCPRCGLHMMNTKKGSGKEHGICESCYHDIHFEALTENMRQKMQERDYQRIRKQRQRARQRLEKGQIETIRVVKLEEVGNNFDERYYL